MIVVEMLLFLFCRCVVGVMVVLRQETRIYRCEADGTPTRTTTAYLRVCVCVCVCVRVATLSNIDADSSHALRRGQTARATCHLIRAKLPRTLTRTAVCFGVRFVLQCSHNTTSTSQQQPSNNHDQASRNTSDRTFPFADNCDQSFSRQEEDIRSNNTCDHGSFPNHDQAAMFEVS